jgi:hypothetical protein
MGNILKAEGDRGFTGPLHVSPLSSYQMTRLSSLISLWGTSRQLGITPPALQIVMYSIWEASTNA